MEADGKAAVVGSGRGAYFLQITISPEVCKPDVALTIRNISAYHGPTGAHFDLKSWTGDGGTGYSISVENGIINSTRLSSAVS